MRGPYRAKIAGDEQEAKLALGSHQLLQAYSYKVVLAVDAEKI